MPFPLLGWFAIAAGTTLVGKIIYDAASDSGSSSSSYSSGPSEAEIEARRREAQRQAVCDESRAELKTLLLRYDLAPTDAQLDTLFGNLINIENGDGATDDKTDSAMAELEQLFVASTCATEQQRTMTALHKHIVQYEQARDALYILRSHDGSWVSSAISHTRNALHILRRHGGPLVTAACSHAAKALRILRRRGVPLMISAISRGREALRALRHRA